MNRNPYYLLGLLFLISVINYLDRQVLSILQEDIRADLGLTDSQLGLLALGFGVLYAVFALPVGRLADTRSRKGILLVCLSVWSAVTSATALVQSFGALLAARMGVAVGEAGVYPTAHSMIADRFPVTKRATAIAVFGAGVPIGVMLSITLGGLISDGFGWRSTFLFFGLPGLALAILFYLTVAEPKRGGADGIEHVAEQKSVWATLKRLAQSRGYVFVVTGATAQALVGYSTLHWLPSYYIRTFNLTPTDVAVSLGPVVGLTGLVGTLATAYLADRMARRDVRWYAWLLAASMVLSYPFYILALQADTYQTSLVLMAAPLFFATAFLGISNALVQSLVPVRMRGMAAAVKTVCLNIIGFGVGGQLVGILSDIYSTDVAGEGLKTALMIVGTANLLALILYLASARHLANDIKSARADSEARREKT